MCSEICQFKVAPKSAMFGRPVVAVSTRMCVAEYVSSSLHPTFQGYKGFADEVLLQAYTCVLPKSGLHPRVEILSELRQCCCEHTHACCRNQGCTKKSKCYQGFAVSTDTHTHTRASHTHTRALRTRSLEGCTQEPRVQGFGRPLAAASTHMCVEQNKSIQGCTQRSICYKAMADRVLL